MKKVALGLSGGVDSSVCASLLKENNYDVIGLFMKNWHEEDENGVCTATDDSIDAMKVAHALDIPFYTVNFEKEYSDNVFAYFLKEYKRGRTPNPDILCNREIKFHAFLHYALSLDADYIAMGHYADTRKVNKRTELLRGADESKDQSYFLSRTKEEALAKCIFPLGKWKKEDVRKYALEKNLPTALKKDSTGICFIGEKDFNRFLDKFLDTRPGNIVDKNGNIVGKHSGLIHYTLGQRRGLGIGGGHGDGEPWFVSGKDTKNNIIYAVQGAEHPALYSKALIAKDMIWIGEKKDKVFECTAKVRYRQKDLPVKVTQRKKDIFVEFPENVRAATPGQTIALYDGKRCLGGAVIDELVPLKDKYKYMNPLFED